MNKKLLILLVLFFNFYLSQAQCPYPAAATSVGNYSFCVDENSNIISTANLNAGQFALVNVLYGSTYRSSVGNLFSTIKT